MNVDLRDYLTGIIATHEALSSDAFHAQQLPKAKAALASLIELIEADRDYDSATAGLADETVPTDEHDWDRFKSASERRAAALAQICGAK